MLGLVADYGSSDEEEQQQEQQPQQQGRQQQGPRAPSQPAERDTLAAGAPAPGGLPSAAALFGEGAAAAAAAAAGPAPMQATVAGAKRSKPESRPLPNPLAGPPGGSAKVPRSGGAASAPAGRPPPGVLLPPQLRGRANVATEDLGSIFTRDATRRLQAKAQAQQEGGQGQQ